MSIKTTRQEKAREYYLKNIEKIKRRKKELRQRPGTLEREREYARTWRKKNPSKMMQYHAAFVKRLKKDPERYEAQRKRWVESTVRVTSRLRLVAINIYSNGKMECMCCGEKEVRFLTLDHKNGNGKRHRAELVGAKIYHWLKRNNYPRGLLEVLCANCNLGRQWNGGECPHKEK